MADDLQHPEPDQDDQMGAIAALPDDDADDVVKSTTDGGAVVSLDEQAAQVDTKDFYKNIAGDIDSSELARLGNELKTAIDEDLKTWSERTKLYAEGMERTGFGKDAPGGATFSGASRVTHPVLAKASVDFEARAIAELLPPGGPVKDFIPGKMTPQRQEKADRKTAHMNWQFVKQMPEFRGEFEQCLSQTSIGGSQFMFGSWDVDRKRPMFTYVPSDDVIVPYSASSILASQRTTMIERNVTQAVFNKRVASGYYIEPVIGASSLMPEQTEAGKAADAAQGKNSDSINIDGIHTIWRVFTYAQLEGDDKADGESLPYMIEMEADTGDVKRVVRNWLYSDEQRQPMHWLIEFPFLPWRGALSIGLVHAIGSLSGAATGAIRALLDSAHFNNLPALIKLKGANFSGQVKSTEVGSVYEVEGGVGGIDGDIRKIMMPVPYNPPSPVLLQLLGEVTGQAESFVQTTLKNLTDENINNLPVGTTLSAIEEGLKVLSGVHIRLHAAMGRLLEVLHRINALYLDEEELKDDVGEVLALRSDYNGPMDVVPVSDPNIFSDSQRFAQVQLVAQRAQLMPQIYDLRKVEELILERTKIPNAKDLLLPKQTASPLNAVAENAAMALGRPVAAFPNQEHLAHLQVHLDFMNSPFLGQLSSIAPRFLSGCLQHISEHVAMYYVQIVDEECSRAAGVDITTLMNSKDADTDKEMDRLLAQASQLVMPMINQRLASIPAIIQRAQQLLQQFQPNMPQDPSLQVAQIGAQAKAQDTQARVAIADKSAKQKQEDNVVKMRTAQMKMESDLQRVREQDRTKILITDKDNQTAMTIAQAEILAGNRSNFSTGESIGET